MKGLQEDKEDTMYSESYGSKIIIKGLKIYAYHGKLPEEKKLGQFFLLDVVIYFNFLGNIPSDTLENTINYVEVINFIKEKFTEKKFNLIETAAEYLCDSVLEYFQKIYKVGITLRKPTPPVNADFDYVAVEIMKSRDSLDSVLL